MPSSIGQHSLLTSRPKSTRQRSCRLHHEDGVGLSLGSGVGRAVAVVGDAEGARDGGPTGDFDGAGVGDAEGASVSTGGSTTGGAVGAFVLSQQSWNVELSSIGQQSAP